MLTSKENIPTGHDERCSQEILHKSNDRFSTFGSHYVFGHPHEVLNLCPCLNCLRNVDIHLVSIEISIERSTNTLIESESPSWRNFNFETHHTDSVQTGLPVKYNNISIPQMSLHHISHPQLNFTFGSMNRKFLSIFGDNKVSSSQFIGPFIHTFFQKVD